MTLIRTPLDPLRRSLFAALGLLAACGPGKGETETDAQTETGATDPGTASNTTGATDTGTASASVGATDSGTGTATASTATDPSAGTITDPTTIGSATDTGEPPPPACAGTVTELMQANVDPPTPSGFVQCDGGIVHRPEKRECLAPVTPTSCPEDASDLGQCKTDADCTEKPFGSCQIDMIFGGALEAPTDTCSCVYGCQTDDDCAAGEVCRCAGDVLGMYTECVPATCITDVDCPGGEICGFSPDICEPGVFASHCTTPADTCEGDADCGGQPCVWNEPLWSCSNAACGRPFYVDDAAITAGPAARDDWRALLAAPAAPAALRPRLAAYWTRIGLCEHASVASFARFILQLLAVGAPPELVLAGQQALADEVEHARLCFALASLYQGTGVGPGPLPAATGADASDLESVVAAVIREACVGETLSALEAREAAARAEDPTLRRVLARIADDEQRHAELGWRFVQWALARLDAAAQARAASSFNAAIAGAEATVAALAGRPAAPELRPHGVVDEPLRAALWREGLRALVRPAAEALRAAA